MSNHPKIKVLHVVPSFNMGGMENGVVNLINHTNPDVFSHEICCITTSGNADLRLKRRVRIFEMHKREGNDWRLIPRLVRLMRKREPDIVHTRNWGATDAILSAKIAGVRTVIHGEHGWNIDDPRGKIKRRLIARKLMSHAVNCFVAVSEDIKRWLIKSAGVKSSEVSTIINGVDTDKFRPKNKEETRKAFGFSKRDLIIGTVGRLDPIKNQHKLLYAFAKIANATNNLHLVLVGDGPERHRLESIKETFPCGDRITFFGERDDVHEILPILDVFVLPSTNEGISNTILEAMATGLPVIATNVGGNPELVQHKHTGFLVPPANCDALVCTLNVYIEDAAMAEVHGKNGRKRAVRDFSLEHMVKEYETLYTTLQRRGISAARTPSGTVIIE